MECEVRIHHPKLTEEERKIQEEKIIKALIEFYKEVKKEKEKCL